MGLLNCTNSIDSQSQVVSTSPKKSYFVFVFVWRGGPNSNVINTNTILNQ